MTEGTYTPGRLLRAVRRYAVDHFTEDGWEDFALYNDDAVFEMIGDAATLREAISRCREAIRPREGGY